MKRPNLWSYRVQTYLVERVIYCTDGTCDEVPSGHRLQRLRSEPGGECTDRLGKFINASTSTSYRVIYQLTSGNTYSPGIHYLTHPDAYRRNPGSEDLSSNFRTKSIHGEKAVVYISTHKFCYLIPTPNWENIIGSIDAGVT